jgi:hypothetical protein
MKQKKMSAEKCVLFLIRSLFGNCPGILIFLTLQPHVYKCDLSTITESTRAVSADLVWRIVQQKFEVSVYKYNNCTKKIRLI